MSHNTGIPEQHQNGAAQDFYQQQQGGGAGYMPTLQNQGGIGYTMAGSPGRGPEFAGAGWEMASALTPIGEGMLRELMSIGGPMDMGNWEGQAP